MKTVEDFSEQKSPLVYLDYNATSPLHPDVLAGISEVASIWGNPSSIHWAGRQAKTIVRESRQAVAQALGVNPLEIIFTSGGSEGNNTVLQSFFEKSQTQNSNEKRNEFIATKIEHPSVLRTLEHFKQLGAIVHLIDVDRDGNFDFKKFKEVLSEKTALVFVMAANNETGLVLPIKEIANLAHSVGAKVHTDAVQAYGKIPLNLQDLDVDFATVAAHKFYAFKGAGALYVKKGNDLRSLIFGGGQERHRRGGTENTLGIWSMGVMASKAAEISVQANRLAQLRSQMENKICSEISDVKVTHGNCLRLPNTSSLVIAGVDGDTLLMSLDVKGVAVSTGSACSSGSSEPSPGLRAMGLSFQEAQSSLRVSMGWFTTNQEIENFVELLKSVVVRLRGLKNSESKIEMQDKSIQNKQQVKP